MYITSTCCVQINMKMVKYFTNKSCTFTAIARNHENVGQAPLALSASFGLTHLHFSHQQTYFQNTALCIGSSISLITGSTTGTDLLESHVVWCNDYSCILGTSKPQCPCCCDFFIGN
jgi:hypothetical protein